MFLYCSDYLLIEIISQMHFNPPAASCFLSEMKLYGVRFAPERALTLEPSRRLAEALPEWSPLFQAIKRETSYQI